MSQACVEDHKVVSFTYVIVDENGTVVEQSDMPLSYVHGLDQDLFPKLMQAMAGRCVGDSVEVSLTPDEGFGQPDPSLIVTEARENVPPEFQRLGAEAMFENPQGETITLVVTHLDAETVTLDGNHPFAGKTVRYKLKVTDIRDATMEEIGTGRAQGGMGGPPLH